LIGPQCPEWNLDIVWGCKKTEGKAKKNAESRREQDKDKQVQANKTAAQTS
jgi:hypothetical protein